MGLKTLPIFSPLKISVILYNFIYITQFYSLVGSLIKAPLTQYNVTKGAKYRFRVIAVGSLYPLRISVDSHNLTLVASDGYDLKQRIVESIIINPGERFDFLLDANQPVGNYWVRAVSMEVSRSILTCR